LSFFTRSHGVCCLSWLFISWGFDDPHRSPFSSSGDSFLLPAKAICFLGGPLGSLRLRWSGFPVALNGSLPLLFPIIFIFLQDGIERVEVFCADFHSLFSMNGALYPVYPLFSFFFAGSGTRLLFPSWVMTVFPEPKFLGFFASTVLRSSPPQSSILYLTFSALR